MKFDTVPRGNKLSGEIEYEVGDITGSSEVDGEREVPVSLAGTWNVVIEAEGQVFEPVMKVTDDGGKLAVEYLTDEDIKSLVHRADSAMYESKKKGRNSISFVPALS